LQIPHIAKQCTLESQNDLIKPQQEHLAGVCFMSAYKCKNSLPTLGTLLPNRLAPLDNSKKAKPLAPSSVT
jgi:hypothetical protein